MRLFYTDMLKQHYVAENTLLCELHNTTIHKTIQVRGESEQRAIKHNGHFLKRKSKNGYIIFSHLKYTQKWREK